MADCISTRNHLIHVSSHQAILQGLAEDGGLFVPASIHPFLNLRSVLNCSYQDLAEIILNQYFNDYSPEMIHACTAHAYDSKFDTPDITPLVPFSDGYLLELFHGPTCAFKDLALSILPSLMSQAWQLENQNQTIAVLTATSGDTGKAALTGFADVPHTDITVFYPQIGVSAIQKMQMQTSKGNNVDVIAVEGNFDDCQKMVKDACRNEEIRKACHNVSISSANSINIGRLIPQMVYYVKAYLELVNRGVIQLNDPVNFAVPTGNFGDILAGYLAKLSGLPIKKLICASNSNHVLTDFIQTGIYSCNREFTATMSPSMDILVSSNLERLLYLMSGNNDTLVRTCMKNLQETGVFTIPVHLKETIQCMFSGYWCDEDTCLQEIHDMHENSHILIDPHTAVAVHAMHAYQKETEDPAPCIVLSTASPYKFPNDVLFGICGRIEPDGFRAMDLLEERSGVPIPENLKNLRDLPIRFTKCIEPKDGMKVILDKIERLSHD